MITLCSVYSPPSFAIKSKQLNSLLQQLPPPFILLGDFNGHSVLVAVKIMMPEENFITKSDICLMIDKSHTYLDSGKDNFLSIDISLCQPKECT